ncbi:18340_t:CDS:1 [Funneliformis geosporum]|uniref:12503_t:CDS:1 n=1 Tax=Funneliformis geosporum TaxID=1117311 RepID=A0A9W4SGR6_9GLOM|nr:18340_t:CDS:1 [Funneliformis geosporum]CAI2168478.1 12503_t:CDS:1 [Funneliformis geosporum]
MVNNITVKYAFIGIIFAFMFYAFSINHQLIISNIKLIYKPTFYHGEHIHKNYFEGWYYKTVITNESLIIIPGIYKSALPYDGKSHAFVMVIRDGYECLYYRYNISEFNSKGTDSSKFMIRIGQNKFSENEVVLSLPAIRLIQSTDIEYDEYTDLLVKDWSRIMGKGSESKSKIPSLKSSFTRPPFIPYSVRGYISFNDITPYPFTYTHPNVMGIFAYIPFLECNHGIISMSHRSSGMVEFINMENNGIIENRMDLESGFGYIEKDWGVNFPESWIWSQSNKFINEKEEKSSSILISIADIPLVSSDNPLLKIPYLKDFLHFPGRIIIFYHAKSNITYNFSTYNLFSKVIDLVINMDENNPSMQYVQDVKLHVMDISNGLNLEINIKRKFGNGIPLRSPSKQFGKMALMIEESLDAELHVKLWRSGKVSQEEEVIFNDHSIVSGLEIVGNVWWIVSKLSAGKV